MTVFNNTRPGIHQLASHERMIAHSENDDKVYHRFIEHAYSIWLQPAEQDIFNAFQRVIKILGSKYEGTFHQPHVTLYGALYTGDEEYVKAIAAEVASTMKPFYLLYKSIDCKQPNNTNRLRAGVTIRYHVDRSFMNAANRTMLAYNQSDIQKPHSTLLYDFNGDSYRDPLVLNRTINQLEKSLTYSIEQLKWKADTIHVFYTPLRVHWKSSKDVEEIVEMLTTLLKLISNTIISASLFMIRTSPSSCHRYIQSPSNRMGYIPVFSTSGDREKIYTSPVSS